MGKRLFSDKVTWMCHMNFSGIWAYRESMATSTKEVAASAEQLAK